MGINFDLIKHNLASMFPNSGARRMNRPYKFRVCQFARTYESFRNETLCPKPRKPIRAKYSGRAVFHAAN